jgi:hypothetical protein
VELSFFGLSHDVLASSAIQKIRIVGKGRLSKTGLIIKKETRRVNSSGKKSSKRGRNPLNSGFRRGKSDAEGEDLPSIKARSTRRYAPLSTLKTAMGLHFFPRVEVSISAKASTARG